MDRRLVILGSGGYGHTVADVAEQLGYNILFLDDRFQGHELSTFSSHIDENTSFIPAFGNSELRLSWCNQITQAGGKLVTLIHPTAYVSSKARIEEGVVILPHAIINTDVVVEKGSIINLGAVIDHGCIIEEGCHICLGAIVKGENHLPRCIKIEAGEVVERGQYPL